MAEEVPDDEGEARVPDDDAELLGETDKGQGEMLKDKDKGDVLLGVGGIVVAPCDVDVDEVVRADSGPGPVERGSMDMGP